MKSSLRLTASQKQQLKLNPMQVQFGRMLELTGHELEDEIRRTVDDNPALEIKTPEHETEHADTEEGYNESAEDLQRADYASAEEMPFAGAQVKRGDAPQPWESTHSDGSVSLYEALAAQLAFSDLNDEERKIALYIAGNLDDSG